MEYDMMYDYDMIMWYDILYDMIYMLYHIVCICIMFEAI